VATRLAGTDGVSLETAKWTTVLGRLGVACFFFAGEFDRPRERGLRRDLRLDGAAIFAAETEPARRPKRHWPACTGWRMFSC